MIHHLQDPHHFHSEISTNPIATTKTVPHNNTFHHQTMKDNDIDKQPWSILHHSNKMDTAVSENNINNNLTTTKNRILSLSLLANNMANNNKYSKADRRLFYSFNQLLLSLVAPRLMRYQFDLMMHSVIAELFRKIFVPVLGSTIKGVDQQQQPSPIFSTLLSNLLNRNRIPSLQQQQVTITPNQNLHQSTTASPNLDLQRLLDNAQKLIALQTLIRNGQRTQQQQTTDGNNKPVGNEHSVPVTSISDNNQRNRENNESQSNKSNDSKDVQQRPTIQLALSSKDFIDFLKNNWKQSDRQKNNNAEEKIVGAYGALDKNNNNFPMETDFHINQNIPKSLLSEHWNNQNVVSNNIEDINKLKSSTSSTNTNTNSNGRPSKKKLNNFYKQKAKLEDFKMSHLIYIDTEVPNYGNQKLLVNNNNNNPHNTSNNNGNNPDSSIDNNDNQSMTTIKPLNEDMERANRWNNVLSNMIKRRISINRR